VPKEAPVVLQLASVDVIHSFYLPNLRIKTDAVPGMVNRLWFQAQETGQFEIACAQHCGVHHYKMRGILTVLERERYDDWLRRMSRQAAIAFDPNDEDQKWGWDWTREDR
jgi:cytochrome c oxidase subunit 2